MVHTHLLPGEKGEEAPFQEAEEVKDLHSAADILLHCHCTVCALWKYHYCN